MAIVTSRMVQERNTIGNPYAIPAPRGSHTLALDLTANVYTLTLDGATVTGLAALAADPQWATVTTAGASAVLHCRDLYAVARHGGNGLPFGTVAQGMLLVANFANFDSFIASAARSHS